MLLLVTYDIDTTKVSGAGRLQHIAKLCLRYGQRVQNSVFECNVDAAQYRQLKAGLLTIIDEEKDSVRLYNLGNKYHEKVEHFGRKPGYDAEDVLII